VSEGCPLYRLAAQRRALASSEGWGAGEPRCRPPGRERAPLRLLGLVGLLLFILEVLGRAALSRSLLVKALSLLELALAAWGLRRLEEGWGERAPRGSGRRAANFLPSPST
jgi:hypothetical protein